MLALHKLTLHSVRTEAEIAGRWALRAARQLHWLVRRMPVLAEEIHFAAQRRTVADTAAVH